MSMKLKENEMKFIYAIDLDFLTTKLTKKETRILDTYMLWLDDWLVAAGKDLAKEHNRNSHRGPR